jgi:myo-inositol-1(or 4)-monophosphatase
MIATEDFSTLLMARKNGIGATKASGPNPSGGKAAHIMRELAATSAMGTMATEDRRHRRIPIRTGRHTSLLARRVRRGRRSTIIGMEDLGVAIEAARAGGAIVAAGFGKGIAAEYKAKFDPVTEVDKASEAAVTQVIASHRPDDAILAEEAGGSQAAGRQWIVDPLDGTVNFVHGIPQVSVSVALYDDNVGVVGVVFDPLRDELFAATTGSGATLNGRRLQVSDARTLQNSVVATGFPYDHDIYADDLSVVVREVLRHVNGLRRFGSAALDLAWVAAGRFDAYWELGIAPWDGAAGLILVREAGGIVTDPWGVESDPFRPLVVASNGIVHEHLRVIVEEFCPPHFVAR